MAGKPFIVAPCDLGAITTGNEAPGRPASHLGEFLDIGMVWESIGNTDLWVRGDFGMTRRIDFAGVLAANAGPGTTIRLRMGDTQAEVDGAAPYDSGPLPFITPGTIDDDGLYHSHLELPEVQPHRWWRIDIGGHVGDFSAAKLILGKKVQSERYYSSGAERGVSDMGGIEIGRWGIPSVTDGLIFRTLAFTLGWVSETAYEGDIEPLLRRLGKRNVALCCFDPDAGPWRQARTYFGWLQTMNAAKLGTLAPGRYQQDFAILSMI